SQNSREHHCAGATQGVHRISLHTIFLALTSHDLSCSPGKDRRLTSASTSSPVSARLAGRFPAALASSLASPPTPSSALGIRYSPGPSPQAGGERLRCSQRMLMLKKLIQSTFNKFGYRIIRDRSLPYTSVPRPDYGLEPFFSLLKRYGFNPKHIIDVGANTGTWTRRALPFFPCVHYTL